MLLFHFSVVNFGILKVGQFNYYFVHVSVSRNHISLHMTFHHVHFFLG